MNSIGHEILHLMLASSLITGKILHVSAKDSLLDHKQIRCDLLAPTISPTRLRRIQNSQENRPKRIQKNRHKKEKTNRQHILLNPDAAWIGVANTNLNQTF